MSRFEYMCRALRLLLKGLTLHMEAMYNLEQRPEIAEWVKESRELSTYQ